jgi:hypothetical protein
MAPACSLDLQRRRKLVPALWRLTVCVVVAAVFPAVYEMHRKKYERHVIAWFVGGVFAGLAVLLAVHQILQHLIHYRQPLLQKYVVRILAIVPIYATNSWLGLRFKHITLYLDVLRDCYEAFVIYSFVKYLMTHLGSETHLASKLAVQPVTRHVAPFCFLKDWELPSEFIYNIRVGVLQYVVVKPLLSILVFVLESRSVYCYGEIAWSRCGYVYITFVNNCSQIWALYILVLFYQATKAHLQPIRPLHKFMCVKAVIFFTWWQSVAIALLVEWGVVTETATYTEDDIASGLQNLLICVEMFFAALLHRAAFSHTDYSYSDGGVHGGDGSGGEHTTERTAHHQRHRQPES